MACQACLGGIAKILGTSRLEVNRSKPDVQKPSAGLGNSMHGHAGDGEHQLAGAGLENSMRGHAGDDHQLTGAFNEPMDPANKKMALVCDEVPSTRSTSKASAVPESVSVETSPEITEDLKDYTSEPSKIFVPMDDPAVLYQQLMTGERWQATQVCAEPAVEPAPGLPLPMEWSTGYMDVMNPCAFDAFASPAGCASPVGAIGITSVGSVRHGTGTCKPCAWYWKPRGCQNNADCNFCHLCPDGELRTRKKAKIAARTQIKRIKTKPSDPSQAPSNSPNSGKNCNTSPPASLSTKSPTSVTELTVETPRVISLSNLLQFGQ